MKRERKPAWLRLMAPAGNQYGYHARRCNCGRWLFQTRDQCQWEDWDAGLLVGDDEESMSAYAQKLDQFAHPKPQGMPNQGMQPSGTAGANPMGDVVNQMFDNLN